LLKNNNRSAAILRSKKKTTAWLRGSETKPNVDVTTVFIARQHTDARYWYSKSVRLSVCP